jgi:hypothetical protein
MNLSTTIIAAHCQKPRGNPRLKSNALRIKATMVMATIYLIISPEGGITFGSRQRRVVTDAVVVVIFRVGD